MTEREAQHSIYFVGPTDNNLPLQGATMFQFKATIRHQNSRPIQSIDFRNDLAGSLTAVIVEVSAGLATSIGWEIERRTVNAWNWFKRTASLLITECGFDSLTPLPYMMAFAPVTSYRPIPAYDDLDLSDDDSHPDIVLPDDPTPTTDHAYHSGGTDEPIEMWEQMVTDEEQTADRQELGGGYYDETWEEYVERMEEYDRQRLDSQATTEVREDREPMVMPSANQVTSPATVTKRDGLTTMSVKALRSLAKEEECVGYSKLTKPELIECIRVRRYEIATTD